MSTIDASEEVRGSVPASPPRENLYRAAPGDLEIVRGDGTEPPLLRGHFAVFNTPTLIDSIYEGRFIERIAAGAFTKTIAEGRDQMRVMFQHGKDPQIGEKVLGPIQTLREDEQGAYYEVPLLDTSYNRDLIPAIEAGLYGASFRFKVMKEEFVGKPARSTANPDGIPERTVTEAQVREFGPVVWGAYPQATAGLRSMTDEFLFAEFAADPSRLQQLCRTSGISLTGTTTWPFTATSGTNAGITIYNLPAVERAAEPDPPEGTTPDEPEPESALARESTENESEPEPSEATTHSLTADFFRFAAPPKHMRSK